MSNPIEKLLSFLDPQVRKAGLQQHGFYGGPQEPKTYAGAVKSPKQGTGKKTSPLLAFAQNRRADALSLGVQGGLEIEVPPPAAEPEPFLPPKANSSSSSGNTAAGIFRNTLAEGGLPPHVIDGIMMNGEDESGFDPTVYGDNGAAVGILQWNGPRQRALKQFAQERGMQYNDPRLQGLFTLHELQGSEKAAGDALLQTKTAGEAGAVFVNKYERPAEVHRAAREAKYLGRGGGEFVVANEGLTYGPEISGENPMTEKYVGRTADTDTASMGMDAGQFAAIKEQYGERVAMDMLNNSQGEAASSANYPDAILRFLEQQGAPANKTAAEEQADVIANSLTGGFAGAPYSMGSEVPESGGTPPTIASSGGGAAAPAGASAASPATEDDPGMTAVDRLLNTIYGTDVEDMTKDERADRRRSIGIALTQGFSMLSGNGPMDVQGIVTQRMDLQAARRAAADLKQNAQGVSDMLVASGMDELAQLPFAGESGMNAAMNALVSRSTQAGDSAPFDLPPSVRATVAQTMSDMGQGGLAEQIMNMPAGDALKELYQTTLGVESTPPKGGEGGTSYTPEQRASLASQFAAAGNPFAAESIMNGADDKTIGDLIKAQAGVAPAVQQAGGVAAVQAGVDAEVETRSAEAIARGYEAAGMQEEAAVARAAGSGEEAKKAVDDMRADKVAATEAQRVKERGEAVAALVPADLENADQLKAAARSAQTSQDLDQVYAQIADDPKTTEEQLYDMSKKDPAFLPFLTDLMRAKAGTAAPVPIATQFVLNEVNAVAANHIATAAGRKTSSKTMETIRQIVANPDFTPGKVQGNLLMPAQEWLTSVLGDAAPDLASEADLTGKRLVESMQAAVFVAASENLKGAISDKETTQFLKTAPSVTDTKTQMLALAQFNGKIADIQEAEYAAMVEWVEQAEQGGTLGKRQDMISYIEERTGNLKVFEQITEDTLEAWFDDPNRQLGEVVQIVRPDGSSTYVSFTSGE